MQRVMTRSQGRSAQVRRLRNLGISFLGIAVLAACGDDKMGPKLDEGGAARVDVMPSNTHGGGDLSCMGDDAVTFTGIVSGFGTDPNAFNCTANDIRLANARLQGTTGPIECVEGDMISVNIVADVVETATSQRTDIGIWIAEDGGNAETGQCQFFYLNNFGVPGVSNIDSDSCGDMENAATIDGFPLSNLDLICTDPDGDGLLEINSCVSWTIPGGDRACPQPVGSGGNDGFRAGTLPANKSKCNCEPFFVEIEIKAELTLEKDVTNDHGGTAVDTEWTLEAAGPTAGISGAEGDAAVTDVEVTPGDYTLTETGGPANYTEGSWSCDGGSLTGNVVTLLSGESATCTITNDDDPAILTLEKVVVNDNGGSATDTEWTLTATGPTPGTSGTEGDAAITAAEVIAGEYTLSETGPDGYTASAWVCVGGTQVDDKITLTIGQSATCTITNDDNPAGLIVIKEVINDNGGTAVAGDFTMQVTAVNPDQASFPGEVAPGTMVAVDPGAYSVDEADFAGYAKTLSADCSGTIALGESKTCTITNNDIGASLTLIKTVINDNGGTAAPDDFQLTVAGGAVLSGATNGFSANVALALNETLVSGYSFVSITGDAKCPDALGGTVTLAPGDDVTCTITNDDIAPTLTLTKVVENDMGGTAAPDDFNLTVGGAGVLSGVSNEYDANVALALNETLVDGYSFVSLTGDAKCPDALGGTVTLDPGDNVSCTITNTDDGPMLTVIKTVINDNGGTAAPDDFQLTVAGGAVLSGATNSFDAGIALALNETLVSGYSFVSITGDAKCPDALGGTVTLALGDNVTCTITNDDDPAGETTRTIGYWSTHLTVTEAVWFGGSLGGLVWDGVANPFLCVAKPLDDIGKVLGGFWSNIARKSDRERRSALDQARMQLAQQLLAAILNNEAFGSAPAGVSIAQAKDAFCGVDIDLIQAALTAMTAFNESGDAGVFEPGVSANSREARETANIPFWDNPIS